MWYLLFIPMFAIVFFLTYLDTLVADRFDAGRDNKKYIMSFIVFLFIYMAIVISTCIVMSTMTSPVLTDSIYDKIAVEMYYKD